MSVFSPHVRAKEEMEKKVEELEMEVAVVDAGKVESEWEE